MKIEEEINKMETKRIIYRLKQAGLILWKTKQVG